MGFGTLFHRKKKGNGSPSSSNHESPNGSLSPTTTRESRQRSQIEEMEAVFKKFDVNGDGKISSSELGSIMSSLGQAVTEEELQKMIKEIDADGDGYIDFDEFVELNTKGIDKDEALENLKDAFSVYDIDGNGSITAEELHKVLSRLGDDCSIAECRKMIRGVDSDGDGVINFEEFKVMMMMGARYGSFESQRVAVKE